MKCALFFVYQLKLAWQKKKLTTGLLTWLKGNKILFMLPLVAAHHCGTPLRLQCCYRCCCCCRYCCCFCNLIMHLIKEMKFLLRLFAYSLAGSSRRFYVNHARVWVHVCACVCVSVCVLPFCCLFRFVCHIPHFSVARCQLPSSSAFLFSHNFFECGWISAILRCDRQQRPQPAEGGQARIPWDRGLG